MKIPRLQKGILITRGKKKGNCGCFGLVVWGKNLGGTVKVGKLTNKGGAGRDWQGTWSTSLEEKMGT